MNKTTVKRRIQFIHRNICQIAGTFFAFQIAGGGGGFCMLVVLLSLALHFLRSIFLADYCFLDIYLFSMSLSPQVNIVPLFEPELS